MSNTPTPPRPAPVQFRPGELEPELKKRSDGRGLGSVAARDLERYYETLRRSMPPLSRSEAMALVDITNGTIWDPFTISLLWAEVDDAEGLGKKWGLDQAAFVQKLRALTYAQAVAVVDGIERFWGSGEGHYTITETDEALAASGLVTGEEAAP